MFIKDLLMHAERFDDHEQLLQDSFIDPKCLRLLVSLPKALHTTPTTARVDNSTDRKQTDSDP